MVPWILLAFQHGFTWSPFYCSLTKRHQDFFRNFKALQRKIYQQGKHTFVLYKEAQKSHNESQIWFWAEQQCCILGRGGKGKISPWCFVAHIFIERVSCVYRFFSGLRIPRSLIPFLRLICIVCKLVAHVSSFVAYLRCILHVCRPFKLRHINPNVGFESRNEATFKEITPNSRFSHFNIVLCFIFDQVNIPKTRCLLASHLTL